jgi:hypothetical protein
MKLYYVYADDYDYDDFDSVVVVAENEDRALEMINNGGWSGEGYFREHQGEIHIEEVDLTVEHIVLESFNAG